MLAHEGKGKVKSDLAFSDVLIRVCDLMHELSSEFDLGVVKLVFDKHLTFLKDSGLKDVYSSRYGKHHILALMDGIVKTRFLVRGGSLKAELEDYRMLELVWDLMLEGWQVECSGAYSGFAVSKVVV